MQAVKVGFNYGFFYAMGWSWLGAFEHICTFNNPPWFYMELPEPTTDDIEMRMCKDSGSTNEDIAIENNNYVSITNYFCRFIESACWTLVMSGYTREIVIFVPMYASMPKVHSHNTYFKRPYCYF